MIPFASNAFAWAADELKANKPAELAALQGVNLWAENETGVLANDALGQLEAHDPLLKPLAQIAVAKIQSVEGAQLPVVEGDLIDQLAALFLSASAASSKA